MSLIWYEISVFVGIYCRYGKKVFAAKARKSQKSNGVFVMMYCSDKRRSNNRLVVVVGKFLYTRMDISAVMFDRHVSSILKDVSASLRETR